MSSDGRPGQGTAIFCTMPFVRALWAELCTQTPRMHWHRPMWRHNYWSRQGLYCAGFKRTVSRAIYFLYCTGLQAHCLR